MAEIPVNFEIPGNLTIEQLISRTAKKFPLQLTLQYYAVKAFYDSFDWRLYNAELICEFNQSSKFSRLNLINYRTGQLMFSTELEKVPRFAADFTDRQLAQQLLPLLEMRALLPLTRLNLQKYHVNILNQNEKTVVRFTIEEYEALKHRLTLQPIKGYHKVSTRLSQFFSEGLGLKVENKPLFISSLKNQGRKPGDYSSKLNLKLNPALSAQQAVKSIYQHLLQAIKLNEPGTIDATDSEFLHDFRVAIRRTRAGLSQLKTVSVDEITERYVPYFAWLGQITSPTRDLDVYLLNFEEYKASLPEEIRNHLNPLREFLKQKQKAAQQELVQQLKSKAYLSPLIDWENYLQQPPSQTADRINPTLTIKQLADQRIWKVYRRVRKQGAMINDQSPATELHDLRKTCKKLRYLIEFFQSLYPAIEIKTLIKALKELQELLGDFQDTSVQEQALNQFSAEMRKNACPEQTFTAIAALVQVLDAKRCQARCDFAGCFGVFAGAENHRLFKSLFVSKA